MSQLEGGGEKERAVGSVSISSGEVEEGRLSTSPDAAGAVSHPLCFG